MEDIIPRHERHVKNHTVHKTAVQLTLHLLHVGLIAPLPLHHGFHHLLHSSATSHLPLHLLEHPGWHRSLDNNIGPVWHFDIAVNMYLHSLYLGRCWHSICTATFSARCGLHLLHSL
jgi:hypothetical protein